MQPTVKTKVELSPTTVVYRTPTVFSTMVVKIILTNKENPRIISYTEDFSGQTPMSLFLDEILWYINDAKERIKRI